MNITINKNTDDGVLKLARLGMFAKGAIYCILGVLTTLAAFNIGGQTAGKSDALKFLYEQPFGKILLAILTVGLLGYVVWRFVQAIKDPENAGDDTKGIMTRIGYAASGVFYGFLTFEAAKMLFRGGSSGSSDSKNQELVGQLLDKPFGQILVGIVAVVFIGKAIYQFYRAYSGSFTKKVRDSNLQQDVKNLVRKAGVAGYTARGVVIGIIGYFFLKAAIQANPGQAQGSEGAFKFIESSPFGPYLLAIVAIGLVCYGVFMFVKARYRVMPSSL